MPRRPNLLAQRLLQLTALADFPISTFSGKRDEEFDFRVLISILLVAKVVDINPKTTAFLKVIFLFMMIFSRSKKKKIYARLESLITDRRTAQCSIWEQVNYVRT